MNIYRTSQKESFITEITDFILSKFNNSNLSEIKIILPNGYLCNHLQKAIINKIGTAILPNILPINDVVSSTEEIFKVPSDQISRISTLEAKMLMTKIISSYSNLHYSTTQNLILSSSLIRLFFEFEANDINFTALKNMPTVNQAQHWHFIYDFLEFAYSKWQQEVALIKKSTAAGHQKLMLEIELNNFHKTSGHIMLAGVIGNNKITQDFIVEISKLKNSYIIFPPFFLDKSKSSRAPLPEEALYNICKLLNQLKIEPENVPYLSKSHKSSILDNLLSSSPSNELVNKIEYIEFDNIILEAEYVISKCAQLLKEEPNAKIALLITNNKIKNYFTAKLNKYGLNFSDLIGENILNLHATSFIMEVAKNICHKFSVKNFISLILHPLIICDATRKLKQLIIAQNNFAQDISVITEIVTNNFDNNTKEILHNICLALSEKITESSFSAILTKIIKLARIIYPKLWADNDSKNLAITIGEITNGNYSLELENLSIFPEILQELLNGGRIYNNTASNSMNNITICSANEITLINYDLVVYTNFIAGSYPAAKINSPWLNNQMIKEIGLDSWTARFGNAMYDFYLNLHNKKTLITRSIKTNSAANSAPSPFFLSLKHILGYRLIENSVKFPEKDNNNAEDHAKYGSAEFFPKRLSATDIETLIRSPYNFYAKKILNLKVQKKMEDSPTLSEFGNFFHEVAELYSKNYQQDELEKLNDYDRFNNYAKQILNNTIFPKQIKRFWQQKIEAICLEFIPFDKKRRKKAKQIFVEIKGEIDLNICGVNIKITAIADRIELLPGNTAVIMDYKTGALPTKKDVLSGLSPQLVIESLILLEGGFAKEGLQPVETEKLVYVKIASKEPYISTTETIINKNDILQHKKGLINLLSHYITTARYPIEPNLMKYDDYWHLARRK